MFACEASGFDETEPLFDAAGFRAVAIVIENAFAPSESEHGVFAAGEDGCILDRDAALIVVTIEGPGLKLATRELAFVHEQVKRMLVMVALFADGMKAGDVLGLREQRLFDEVVHGGSHRLNSIPS